MGSFVESTLGMVSSLASSLGLVDVGISYLVSESCSSVADGLFLEDMLEEGPLKKDHSDLGVEEIVLYLPFDHLVLRLLHFSWSA